MELSASPTRGAALAHGGWAAMGRGKFVSLGRRRIKSASQSRNKAYNIALPCVAVNRVLCGKSKGPVCSTYGQHSGCRVHRRSRSLR